MPFDWFSLLSKIPGLKAALDRFAALYRARQNTEWKLKSLCDAIDRIRDPAGAVAGMKQIRDRAINNFKDDLEVLKSEIQNMQECEPANLLAEQREGVQALNIIFRECSGMLSRHEVHVGQRQFPYEEVMALVQDMKKVSRNLRSTLRQP